MRRYLRGLRTVLDFTLHQLTIESLHMPLIFILLFSISVQSSLSSSLMEIPNEDQRKIKILFDYLFRNAPFAYSLYFDKPVSFSESALNQLPIGSILNHMRVDEYTKDTVQIYQPCQTCVNGWDSWEKYRDLFKIEKYIFLKGKLGDLDTIFFINKAAFKKMFTKNLDEFRNILGESITAEDLLNRIEENKIDFFDTLNRDEALLGILLGFGTHNANLFKQRELLEARIRSLACLKQSYTIQMKDQLCVLWQKLQLSSKMPETRVDLPYQVQFVGDPTNMETIYLKRKYSEEGAKLSEIYSSDTWFEQTIDQLCK